ncbi:hypothetical protein C1645_839582, partial [Glomus cerebriforme]
SLNFQSDTGKWETVFRAPVWNGMENALRSGMEGKMVLCAFSSILKSETILRTLQSRIGREKVLCAFFDTRIRNELGFFRFQLGNLISFEVVKTFFSEHKFHNETPRNSGLETFGSWNSGLETFSSGNSGLET